MSTPDVCIVASYVGAWIEVDILVNLAITSFVASYVDAWIEVYTLSDNDESGLSRILYRCVD